MITGLIQSQGTIKMENKRIYHEKLPIMVAFAALLLISIVGDIRPAQAQGLSLIINGKSIHIDPPATSNFNEKNWGLGVQYDLAPVQEHWIPFLSASGFSDSNRQRSYYAGGGIARRFSMTSIHKDLHLDAGIIGFVMTRKDYNNNDPFTGALPVISVGTERVAVNITYIPRVHPKIVPLWFFQLKISLENF